MPCIVEATDDDLDNFVAIFSYAGIAASGDTPDEAMRNLCETIELTFAHLSENEAALSPALKRKLDALQEYVRA